MIPIVEKLSDTPPTGDAIWKIQSGPGRGLWTPVREQLLSPHSEHWRLNEEIHTAQVG